VKRILIGILLFTQGVLAQDSLSVKTNRIWFELGVFNNMPFKRSYDDITGSLSTCYSNYHVSQFQTVGLLASIGYGFSISKKIMLVPKINYNYLQLQTEKIGYTTGSLCLPVISGLTIIEGKGTYHLLGLSCALNYKLKKFGFENGVGTFLIGNQSISNELFNYYNRSEFNKSSHKDNFFSIYPFSYHKVSYELLPQFLEVLIGVQFNYNRQLTQSIAPLISLKLKL
jgi:hypothetical protein